ncbi:MAG: lysylphosphatidylglycerol synthase transmembrane domain-containing protein [Acidimicrobiales bacterium]|nr:lysylphosphatidylglycerol synthase transmembrane domain-containing protein [Acidimicrobiales bacterium]
MFSRQRAAVAARLVATAVIAIVLARRVHLTEVLPHRDLGNTLLVAGALFFTLLGIVLSSLRWQRVLGALEVRAKLVTLTRYYFASLFVGNFLPSTVGGDVLRVTRLGAETGENSRPFASVILERLSGWIVLPGLTFAGLLINPTLREQGSATVFAVAVALVTLSALGTVLLLAAHPRIGGRVTGTDGWRRFTGAIHLGVDRFRREPALALEVILASVIYQLSVLVAVFLAGKALDINVGFTAVLAFFPAVAIVQALPVTIGGLGVREGALVLCLRPLDVSTQQAISLGILMYFCTLIVSLVGAPAFAAGGTRKVPRADDRDD